MLLQFTIQKHVLLFTSMAEIFNIFSQTFGTCTNTSLVTTNNWQSLQKTNKYSSPSICQYDISNILSLIFGMH